MTRTTMQEQKDLQVFPADTLLLLKVLEATIQKIEGKNGKSDWEKCRFKFKILQVMYCGDGGPVERFDEMVGEEIWGSVSWYLSNSAENKLRIWSEALLQVKMDLGFELDTNMFPGRTVKGVTSTYTNNQGKERHQVESLIAADQVPGFEPVGQGGWGQPPAGWTPPAPQQQVPPQNGVAQNGWAAPGVQPQQQQWQQPPAAQPQGEQQWAPQQNLMQQDQQQYQQPVQQQAPLQQQPQQGFAQQQVQQYAQQGQPQQPPQQQYQAPPQQQYQQQAQPQQPPMDPGPAATQGQDPWAQAPDPSEPDF